MNKVKLVSYNELSGFYKSELKIKILRLDVLQHTSVFVTLTSLMRGFQMSSLLVSELSVELPFS